jgi:hypothetical protein
LNFQPQVKEHAEPYVTTKLEFPPPFGAIEPAKEQEGYGGKLLVSFLKPEVDRGSSSMLAKVTTKKPPLLEVPANRCHIKVSKMSSSCRCSAVGRNRI